MAAGVGNLSSLGQNFSQPNEFASGEFYIIDETVEMLNRCSEELFEPRIGRIIESPESCLGNVRRCGLVRSCFGLHRPNGNTFVLRTVVRKCYGTPWRASVTGISADDSRAAKAFEHRPFVFNHNIGKLILILHTISKATSINPSKFC